MKTALGSLFESSRAPWVPSNKPTAQNSEFEAGCVFWAGSHHHHQNSQGLPFTSSGPKLRLHLGPELSVLEPCLSTNGMFLVKVTPALSRCVISDKSCHLSELQFPHLSCFMFPPRVTLAQHRDLLCMLCCMLNSLHRS